MAQERRSVRHKLLKYKFRFFTKRLVFIGFFAVFCLRNKKNKQFPRNPTAPTAERIKHRTRLAVTPAGVNTYVERKFVESFADALEKIHNVSLSSMAMSTDPI